MEKVIVVGTNHAGTHAVMTLAENYKDSVQVTTYDSNNNISFLGCGMALWIGEVITAPDGLFYADQATLEKAGAEVYMEHRIDNIDFKNKKIYIKDLANDGALKEDTYDKLILAVGSWPIIPPIKGVELENIIYAKIFQNAQNAINLLQDSSIEKVGVVGAGYIGVELAEAFKRVGKEVVLIDTFNVLNRYYDPEFQEEMAKNIENNGIELALGQAVQEFTGKDGKVTGIITDKGQFDVDLVLLSVGFKANTDFLRDTDLELTERGVIKVDEHQETSIKDVYAIGDCATIHNNATNNEEHIALATNAVRTGIVAGHNAAGTEISMQGVQGSNAIHIFDLTMCSTGLTEDEAKKLGRDVNTVTVTELLKPAFMADNADVTLKVVWDKKTRAIIGAQMMSTEDITLANHFFSLAIQESYSIDRLALLDLFFLPHFNQPKNFITMAGLKALGK